MANQLNPAQTLGPGQSITSTNGKAELIMQADGNLVLYGMVTPGGRKALWSSETWNVTGSPGSILIFQADGNTDTSDNLGFKHCGFNPGPSHRAGRWKFGSLRRPPPAIFWTCNVGNQH
jgi:hypothetical protein